MGVYGHCTHFHDAGEGSGLEFKFSYGLNSAQEPSNCGGNAVYFCLMYPEDFKSILSSNPLIEN